MKNKKILAILFCAIPSIITVSTFTMLQQTSCSSNGLATAPDEFYYKGGDDFVGYGSPTHGMGDIDSIRTIFPYVDDSSKSYRKDAFNLLTDRSKYTANMIKWDIINNWVFNYGMSAQKTKFTAKFVDFEVTPTTIKYKIEVTNDGETNPSVYFTTSSGKMFDEYGAFELKEDLVYVGKVNTIGYSSYDLPLAQTPTGSALNYALSEFYFYADPNNK